MFKKILDLIYINLIKDDRYLYILTGLKNTLIIALFSGLIGIFLGLLLAIIRVTHDNTNKLKVMNFLANLFIIIIRGTPVIVQLMILFFCVFTSRNINNIFVSVIGFGLNSTAYVSEIFRSGLNSVDHGQLEAARSLGLDYISSLKYIILPQAFRNILPALCNEFIALIKETSVAGYVAVLDLTKAADIIKSRTYDAWTPLIFIAIIYLVLTYSLNIISNLIEKDLNKVARK